MNRLSIISIQFVLLHAFIINFNTASAQFEYAKLQDDYNPKSPNSEGLCRYIDFPVTLNTGAMNISIPIYTVKIRGFELPISLDYHTGGIKVTQMASCVGLGWTLNAGGVISRTSKGAAADDRIGIATGYLQEEAQQKNNATAIADFIAGAYPDWEDCILPGTKPEWDMEPDIYSINIPGISGNFTFDKAGNVLLIEEQDIKVIPDLIATGFKDWYIKKSDGTEFHFEEQDRSHISWQDAEGYVVFSPGAASSWHIKTIVSPQLDTIRFYYSAEDESLVFTKAGNQSETYASDAYEAGNTLIGSRPIIDVYQLNRKLIRIETSSDSIEFEYGSNRLDLSSGSRNCGALTYIKVYNKKKQNQIKQYHLITDYFQSDVNASPYSSRGIAEYQFKRLRLNSVEILDGLNQNIGRYDFSYNKYNTVPGNFPPRKSFAYDHWGYYNGQDNNDCAIPSYLALNTSGLYAVLRANKTSSAVYKKAFILDEVKYPTGGVAKFYYESDMARYSELVVNSAPYDYYTTDFSEKPAGGLVIKKTVYDPGDGNAIEKEYEYGTGTLLQGSPFYKINYEDIVGEKALMYRYCEGDKSANYIIYSLPQNNDINGSFDRIFHSPVIVKEQGNGSVEYTYEIDPGLSIGAYDAANWGSYSSDPPQCIVKPFVNSDQPRTISYKNDKGTLLKKIENTYKTYYNRVVHEGDYYAVRETPGLLYTYYTPYNIYSGFSYLESSVETLYDGDIELSTSMNFDYDQFNFTFPSNKNFTVLHDFSTPIHHEPTSQLSSGSADEDILIENECVIDIPSAQRTSVQQQMVDNYLITKPITTKTTLIKDNANKVIDAQYLKYENFGGYFNVSEIYRMAVQEPVNENNFSFGSFTNGQFNINGNYLESMAQFKFDYKGLLVEQRLTNNIPTSYLWGYNNTYTIAKAVNAKYFEVFFDSFEDPNTAEPNRTRDETHIGEYSYVLDDSWGWIDFCDLSSEGHEFSDELKISVWYKTPDYADGTETMNIGYYIYDDNNNELGRSSLAQCETGNEWKMATYDIAMWQYRANYPSTKYFTIHLFAFRRNNSTVYLDDFLVRPPGARVTTYTYDPVVGMTSETDERGRTTTYEYDNFGRLENIIDNEGNVLEHNEYHYAE